MLGVIFVLALAGTAFGDDCCSAEDRREIQVLWNKIWAKSFTDRKVTIAKALFDDLTKRFPEIEVLQHKHLHIESSSLDNPEYRAFLVRFTKKIDTAVNLLDEPAILAYAVEDIGARLGAIGLKKEHIEGVADSFEKVLQKVSGCINIQAWSRCFHKLASAIGAKIPDQH